MSANKRKSSRRPLAKSSDANVTAPRKRLIQSVREWSEQRRQHTLEQLLQQVWVAIDQAAAGKARLELRQLEREIVDNLYPRGSLKRALYDLTPKRDTQTENKLVALKSFDERHTRIAKKPLLIADSRQAPAAAAVQPTSDVYDALLVLRDDPDLERLVAAAVCAGALSRPEIKGSAARLRAKLPQKKKAGRRRDIGRAWLAAALHLADPDRSWRQISEQVQPERYSQAKADLSARIKMGEAIRKLAEGYIRGHPLMAGQLERSFRARQRRRI